MTMGCSASGELQHTGDNYKKSFSSTNGLIAAKGQQTDIVQYLSYPPPVPPLSRKNEIFQLSDVVKLDERVTHVPDAVLFSTYEDLANYLTRGLQTDLLRVRAIFRWLTMLDLHTLEQTLRRLPDEGTPCDYALKIHWKMGNFAHFFAQIAREANLACLVVNGINKSAAYQIGVPIDKKAMAAQWNAVFVDGEWRLLDVFWATTILVGKKSRDWALIDDVDECASVKDEDEGEMIHTVNEFFFLTDPDQLIWTHYPDDFRWQLLARPISEDDFESSVYIRDRFFDLNMSLLPESHHKYLISTDEGKAIIKLGIDAATAPRCEFRCLLYKSRGSTEMASATLERFVFFEKSAKCVTYTITFPAEGLFMMEIFGQDPSEQDSLDLVCAYLIDSRNPEPTEPLPICPDIGWGPGPETDGKGLEPITHKGGLIETDDGNVEIRFKKRSSVDVLQTLKHNQLEEWLLKRFAVVRDEGEDLVIDVRLPRSGQFALEVFADEKGAAEDLPNVCNYLIKCTNACITARPFPKLHEGVLGRSSNCDALKVAAVSHGGDRISTSEEHLAVVFESGADDVEIMCELNNNDISADIMSQTVLRAVNGRTTTFNIGLPKEGEYALNVYARRKHDPERIYHVHSYIVHSTQTKRFQTERPRKSHGIIPIMTNKAELAIGVPRTDGELVGEFNRKNCRVDATPRRITAEVTDTGNVFRLQLPEDGEYKLDVYEHSDKKGLMPISTYLICRDSTYAEPVKAAPVEPDVSVDEETAKAEKILAARHKTCRERLRAAMSSQDQNLLRTAIEQFENIGTPETQANLTKAKQLLQYLQLSEELTTAMTERNLKKLKIVISLIKQNKLKGKLRLQMAMAKRIVEQLKHIEMLRHAIMKLEQRTIAEIKSYATPPVVVNKVMTATLLLLGEREKHIVEWKEVVVQIGKTGRESLKRRVSTFKMDALPIAVATRAKEILSELNLDDVRAVSSGAATFYVWSKGIIEECESIFKQNGGDLSTVRTKSKRI